MEHGKQFTLKQVGVNFISISDPKDQKKTLETENCQKGP